MLEWLGEPEASVARLPGIGKLSEADLAAMARTADALKVPVDTLATIISRESTFNPSLVNQIGAVGLIQFIPLTARALGTTSEKLRGMSFQEQLPFVEKFYRGNGCVGVQDVGDLYLCSFCPAVRKAADDVVIAAKGVQQPGPCHPRASQDRVYKQNSGLDHDKNDILTVGDVREDARATLRKAVGRVSFDPEARDPIKKKSMLRLALGVGAVALGIYTFPQWRGAIGL